MPDEDRDGIRRTSDRCPSLKEDLDGFEDTDGCPDLETISVVIQIGAPVRVFKTVQILF